MPTKKAKETVIWRLRVPLALVAKIKALAETEHRSTTKQAHALLEKALSQ